MHYSAVKHTHVLKILFDVRNFKSEGWGTQPQRESTELPHEEGLFPACMPLMGQNKEQREKPCLSPSKCASLYRKSRFKSFLTSTFLCKTP